MSNRRCNFCMFEDMKKVAATTGRVVSMRPNHLSEDVGSGSHFPDGQDVFIHPQDISDEAKKLWWAGWFSKIGDQCAC